ncbi:MAG TPA: di-heme oxidoredictase family protein [Candidatus Angelobacter sp.]|nr:di-heme oxidoredictase family protein [Candidatus Angelobacter sp.]
MTRRILPIFIFAMAAVFLSSMAFAQADPGVRGGPAGAGNGLAGLSSTEQAFFTAAKSRFQEVDSVSGNVAGENGVGLGPRFNANSCAACHAQPAVGGSSPFTNPQIANARDAGATNSIPSFIRSNGPVREVRFVNNPDGTPDGGVHDLFTITGRSDAAGCNLSQPNFAQAVANGNAIFRIPTPTFGLGLIESLSDTSLIANANNSSNANFGVSPLFNRSGNDGTITRFGWKAQNKSLLIFAGEAYNVEQGVSNEAFPQEREENPNCQYNTLPEDTTNLTNTFNSGSPASDFASDIVNFAGFMRLSEPPAQATVTGSVANGEEVFEAIGCALCHVEFQTTGKSAFTGQTNRTIRPFSDFATHNMGTGLADGVSQGNAGGQNFRSAPLWGLGQRVFFLHDGRTRDLVTAIFDHYSNGSEANTSIILFFDDLSSSQQQDVLNFLRSL